MAELTIEAIDGSRLRYPLARLPVVIGRSRESDIVLMDQSLSRRHAEIRGGPDGFSIVDLGSMNGTLVNGVPLTDERSLRPGDRIALGEFVLTFNWDEPRDPDEDSGEVEELSLPPPRISDAETQSLLDRVSQRRQSRVLEIVATMAGALTGHRTLGELYEYILDRLLEAVPAERGAILLLEGEPPQIVVKAFRSAAAESAPTVSRAIAMRVLSQRVALLVPKVAEDPELGMSDSVQRLGLRSVLCAPLMVAGPGIEDVAIGLVYLDVLRSAHTFTEEDLRILTALANVTASRIENARLLDETLERRRLEQDLRTAAEIQRRLLPERPPTVPGYSLAGSVVPCRAVAGDYYDLSFDGRRLLAALADVSGKGTGAALLTTALRAAVRAHWSEPRLAEAMVRINGMVRQSIPENRYISFLLARLDVESGALRYVNAGLHPPLLARRDGRVERLTQGGVVLGVFEHGGYEEGELTIEPGDALVAFSDGMVEPVASGGEEWSYERLHAAVVAARTLPAEELRGALLGTLARFSHAAGATDDRTLLVVRRD